MDINMTIEQAFRILIDNFPNIGITGVLAFLIWYIISEHGKSTKRDDDFRLELLKVTSNQSILFEKHEQAAKDRVAEQERLGKERDIRDKERLEISRRQMETLTAMTHHLGVVDSTKAAVDTIHTTQIHLQGSIQDLNTDLTGVVNRRAAENLEVYKDTVRESFQLVEAALTKVNLRLDDIAVQDSAAVLELRAISMGLETLKELLKQAQPVLNATQPIPALQDVDDTITPLPETNKDEPPQVDAA